MMTASSCMYQTATTSHVCKIVNAVGEKETFALCGVFNLYNSVPDDGDSNVTSNARCIVNDAEGVKVCVLLSEKLKMQYMDLRLPSQQILMALLARYEYLPDETLILSFWSK